MPLAVQAVLPLLVLLAAAAIVRLRPRHPWNGWIAFGATGIAAAIALAELLRLAPGERVDVPYVTTFPYADLAIRLDGLSLAFVTITLITAALLMLSRRQDRTDRRDPWLGWLLTCAAVTALLLAANLLLLYILLQVVTLTWSGALDERARRRRGLRLTMQIADIGLLLAAASAIQSVGTSAFSGVPSDTFGVATFGLMLLPVVVRIAAIALGARRPLTPVTFGPSIAWLAPAAYVLLRSLALMGGRLPDRPTAVILFAVAALAGLIFAAAATWAQDTAQATALLLAAQGALALAMSTGSSPLLTTACTWLWLLLIPLAGFVGIRREPGSAADAVAFLQLSILPVSAAFTGLWLAEVALNAQGLLVAAIPLALVALTCAVGALGRIAIPSAMTLDASTIWGGLLLLVAAFPLLVMNPLVIPAAATVRLVPAGTISASALGLTTTYGAFPALLVCAVVLAGLGVVGSRFRSRLPLRPSFGSPWRPTLRPITLPDWPPGALSLSRVVLWGILLAAVALAAIRP